jgi:hypothetical protein
MTVDRPPRRPGSEFDHSPFFPLLRDLDATHIGAEA